VGLVLPLTTWAEEAPPSAADTLEEVIVTAQMRAEPLLDVPVSISVISAADIERLHATNLRDLEAAVPGFTIIPTGSPGQAEIVVRGLPVLTGSGGSLVSTFIDDASVGSSTGGEGPGFALDMLPYDIERVEILRGPQGTLYGANSMGGVLKYVTKDPNLTTSEAQIGGEAFDIKGGGSLGTGARGTWSAPLIPGVLAARASVYDEESPGYIKNPLRGTDHENTLSQYGGRLAMLWQPVTNVQVKLQGIYQRINSGGNAIIFADVSGTAQDPYYRPGFWAYGDLTYPHYIAEPFSSEITFISGTLNWHTSFGDLVAVSSYSDKDVSKTLDFTGLLLLDPSMPGRFLMDAGTNRVSQEVRLASPSGQRLDWLAGAYYTHEQGWNDQYVDALDAQLNPIPTLNPYFEWHIPTTYSEAAVFGTLTYRVTDEFDLTGGLRWLTNTQQWDVYVLHNYENPGSTGHTQSRSAETPATYTFSASFRPRPETMTYVRIASGYRPGTVNTFPGEPEIPPMSKSDTMVDYEIGVKSELVNRRATLDLDVFKINWKDMQVSVPTADGRIFYTINAGNVTSEGGEITATYRSGDALQLSVNGAYADAYATQAVPAVGIFVGTRLPSSPKWTAAAMLDYRLRDLENWTPQFSVIWRYVSETYTGLSTPPPASLAPAYSWVNVDLRMTRGRYKVALYAKNLFDKRTFDNGGAGLGPQGTGFVFGGFTMDPRVVGLSATMTL
jgi:outer membrane receptor protein involved in Fe transport